MNAAKINKSLVDNAFDFLGKAIDEFEESPKYSVIHFYSAIELILKSRLLQEHWSLVVSNPQKADRERFVTGNFQSAGLEDANVRLKTIANDAVGMNALAVFKKLSTHRNQLMHFFHPEIFDSQEKLQVIVAEQCAAWFHLYELLTKQWKNYFSDWQDEIKNLNCAMEKHREFLAVKFEQLSEEIADLKKQGGVFVECSACGFVSAEKTETLGDLSSENCLVCDFSSDVIEVDCPACGYQVKFIGEGHGTCLDCFRSFEPDDLFDLLIDDGAAHIAARDGDDSYEPANCGHCDGYHTVVLYEGKYFCAECFDLSDGLGVCGWCNEGNTGDIEHSYSFGCNHCDGQMGWLKDD